MTVESLGPRAHRFEYLDVLRLICAAAVVFFHFLVVNPFTDLTPRSLLTAPSFLVYGQFGVEVFFMISGFVITLSARGRTPGKFLWARFLRLYPAFWICCIATALIITLSGNSHHTLWKSSWVGFGVNLTMLAGFLHTPYVDQVYWSLKPELQFYAFVALLMMVRIRIDALLVITAWLALCVVEPFTSGTLAKLLNAGAMTAFAPFFIVGILIQSTLDRQMIPAKIGLLAVALALACRLSFAHALEFASRGLPSPNPYVSVTCVLIGAALVFVSAYARAPARYQRPMIILGAMTFPLYLIHNSAGAVLTGLLIRFVPASVATLIAMVVVVSAAAFIALVLEPALRNVMRRFELVRKLQAPVPVIAS